jgi:hypothetical protein
VSSFDKEDDDMQELTDALAISPAATVGVLRSMVAAGLDDAGEATARSVVTRFRPRVLSAAEFTKVIRNARKELEAKGGADSGGSQATQLVQMAHERYTFAVTTGQDAIAIPRDGAYVARMLRSRSLGLRTELATAYYRQNGVAVGGSALSDCLNVLEGHAQQSDPVDLALRVAEHDGGLVLDMGDVTGRVILITAAGWEILDRSPVLFRRTKVTLPLPEPARGSTLDTTLRPLLNIGDEDWPLLQAVLVHVLWPNMSHVIPRLIGGDGVAKTWTTRMLRSLIDPCAVPTKSSPRDEKDWIVAINAALIAAIDNVSDIPDWLSDAMCRASTGEGLLRRELYSDSDVSVIFARRIVMLNGIDAPIRRADLARRTVTFELEKIPDSRRRTDEEMEAEWKRVHPLALGAFLDLACEVLRIRPDIHLASKPSMAGFAEIVAAVDKLAGSSALELYLEKLKIMSGDVRDSNPFAGAVVDLVEKCDGEWTGTPSQLLDIIAKPEPCPRSWPKDATRAAVWLRRFASVLERAEGIYVLKGERTNQARPYVLTKFPARHPQEENIPLAYPQVGETSVTASPASQVAPELGKLGDTSGDTGNLDGLQRHASVTEPHRLPPAETPASDTGDASDTVFPTTRIRGESADNSWPEWPAAEGGNCVRCGAPCHRYGEGGNPTCADCRSKAPNPADVARSIQPRRQP